MLTVCLRYTGAQTCSCLRCKSYHLVFTSCITSPWCETSSGRIVGKPLHMFKFPLSLQASVVQCRCVEILWYPSFVHSVFLIYFLSRYFFFNIFHLCVCARTFVFLCDIITHIDLHSHQRSAFGSYCIIKSTHAHQGKCLKKEKKVEVKTAATIIQGTSLAVQ